MNQRRKILIATAGSFSLSILLLLTVILPAEFNIDPLGTGRILGLIGLSKPMTEAGRQDSLYDAQTKWVDDAQQFSLGPFESIELKYRLKRDDAILFEWSSTAELVFDFHAEPDGAAKGYAKSFEKGRGLNKQGSYIARFDGIHGWFFENRNMEKVNVSLRVTGFTSEVNIFRGGFVDTITLKR